MTIKNAPAPFLITLFILASVAIPFFLSDFSSVLSAAYVDPGFFAIVFFIALTAACLAPFFFQLAMHGGDIDFFSPTIIVPLLYFSVFGLGTLSLIFGNNQSSLKVLVFSLSGIMFYYLGIALLNLAFFAIRHERPASRVSWDSRVISFLVCGMVAVSFLATIYLFYKGGVLLLQKNIEAKRIAQQQEVSNITLFLMRLITPAFLFYLAESLVRKKIRKGILFPFLLLSLFILLNTVNRHDLFTFGVSAFLIYNFAWKKIKITKLLPILLVGLALLMAVGYYRLASMTAVTPEKAFLIKKAGGNPLVMFLMYSIFQFTVYPGNLAIYFDTFPRILPFEHGYSFVMAMRTALPGHHQLLDEYVKSALHLNFLGGGINPTMLGELYANFGYAGLLGMSIYGGIIAVLYYRMLLQRTAINITIYSYGVSALLLGIIGGFFSFSLPFYFIFVFTMVHIIAKKGLSVVNVT
jgi:oligosaccharide repeat unit polymerase